MSARLLAYSSGKNYLSNANKHLDLFYFKKMKELENKHHYNGQGGGKPPGIGQ
jgi:hypothetical protein